MKKFIILSLFFTLITWSGYLYGQSSYVYQLIAPGVGVSVSGSSLGNKITATGAQFHQIAWYTIGSLSSCTVQVDSSADGVSWSAGGAIASQNCASNGSFLNSVSTVVNFVRVTYTLGTGGGLFYYVANGYINNPTVGGSGTVTSVNGSANGIFSITGGPINGSGTLTLQVAGTSGGVPCFTSATTLGSSAALSSGQFVLGGGALCPTASFNIVPVANGGNGTNTPSLQAGTNVTITGSWPNQTINAPNASGVNTSIISYPAIYGSTNAISGYSGRTITNFLTGTTWCDRAVSAMGQAVTLVYDSSGENGGLNTVPCVSNPFNSFQTGVLLLPQGQTLAQTQWQIGGGNNGLRITGLGRPTSQEGGATAVNDTEIAACKNQTGCSGVTMTPTLTTVNGRQTSQNQALFQNGGNAFTGGKNFGNVLEYTGLDTGGIPTLIGLWEAGGQEETEFNHIPCYGAWYVPCILIGGWDVTTSYGGGTFTGEQSVNSQNGLNLHNYEISYPTTASNSRSAVGSIVVTAGGAGATSSCTIGGGTSTVTATCFANVVGGIVQSVTVTNGGNYTTTTVPTVTLTGGATATALFNGFGCPGGIQPLAVNSITTTAGTNNQAGGGTNYAMGTITLAAAPPFAIFPYMTFQLSNFANGANSTVFNTSQYDLRMVLDVPTATTFTYLEATGNGTADSTTTGLVTFQATSFLMNKDAGVSDRGFANGTLNSQGCRQVTPVNTNNVVAGATASSSGNTVTMTSGVNFPAVYQVNTAIVVSGCNVTGYNIPAQITGPVGLNAGSTTITYTTPIGSNLATSTASCTVSANPANNQGLIMTGHLISGGPTTQLADHNEGNTNGSSIGDTGVSQGYTGIQNNPNNYIINGAHLSKHFGIPLSAVYINECSTGNSPAGVNGVSPGAANIINDEGNSNIFRRSNGRCVPWYSTDFSGNVGGVFTLGNPSGCSDMQNGFSIYSGSADICNSGVDKLHLDFTTGGVKPTVYQSQTNCSVNSVSPAACGSAPTGAFVVPTTTAAYTVNTTAVTTHSRIFLQPITFASDLPSSPTCVAPLLTTDYSISAVSNGVSFSMALTSTTGQTCWEYWVVN